MGRDRPRGAPGRRLRHERHRGTHARPGRRVGRGLARRARRRRDDADGHRPDHGREHGKAVHGRSHRPGVVRLRRRGVLHRGHCDGLRVPGFGRERRALVREGHDHRSLQDAPARAPPERPGEVQRDGARRVAQRVRRRRRRPRVFLRARGAASKRVRVRRCLRPGAGRDRRRFLPRPRRQQSRWSSGTRRATARSSTRATTTRTTSSRRRPTSCGTRAR